MKFIFTLLLIGLTTFSSFSQTQIELGLRTKLYFDTDAKLDNANSRDLNLLYSLNSKFGVSSYMNKIIRAENSELIVSLYTSGTFDEYKNALLKKKSYSALYESQNKDGVKFIAACLPNPGQNFIRIAFAEKDLNVTIIIDQYSGKVDKCSEKTLLDFIEKVKF